MNQSSTWETVVDLRKKLRDANLDHYLHSNLFSLIWWVMLAFIFIWIFLWWKIVDKKRLMEITLYGALTSIIAITLDDIGTSAVAWGYPQMLVPLVPPLIPVDLVMLPILYMVLYQYCSNWKSFIIGSVIIAAFAAFMFEPISKWLRIYELNNWKHKYSFPIYILIALFLKWVMNKIKYLSHS